MPIPLTDPFTAWLLKFDLRQLEGRRRRREAIAFSLGDRNLELGNYNSF